MGKNKLKIEKLSTNEGRQATYSRRKGGIMKKAKELSILCDTDVLLLAFSNTGKVSLCLGENRSIEERIERYANISPQEREKRKSECLEDLKKSFKKADHEVHVQQFMDQGAPQVEDLQKQVQMLNNEITKSNQLLGPIGWLTNLENLANIEVISSLENTLKNMIVYNQTQKEHYAEKVIDLADNERGQDVLNQHLDQNDESLLVKSNDSHQPSPPHNSILHGSSLNAGLNQHDFLERYFGKDFPESCTEINALFKEVQEFLNESPSRQEQINELDHILEPGEKQYTSPQTNGSNDNTGDFLSLPQNGISDTEFVDNLIHRDYITFDGLHDEDLTLANPNTI